MTIRKFLDNYQYLKSAALSEGSVKFKFLFIKNLKQVEKHAEELQEALQKTIQPTERLNEFERKRLDLLRKYAELDESGNPKVDDKGNVIIKSKMKSRFNEKMSDLLEKYKDVFEERNKQLKEYNDLLNEEFDTSKLDITEIPLDLIPESIPLKVLEAMYEFNMVKDD